ncbi:MAG: biotin transporter BioY [Treponema sp.]|jgi:biotin transport system substrate-specific component|nr:biotin transporter BioY [Treponema sp.]
MLEPAASRRLNRSKITGIALTALFAALIAGGTFIAVPLPFSPVPIVLQNAFCVLAGLVLGPALGAWAVGLYLLAGALGLPVFSGAVGGFAHFAGPTGGFLAGYFLAALLAGLVAGKPKAGIKTPLSRIIAAAACGFLVIYVPGVFWLYHITGSRAAAFTGGFLPFLPGDIVKAAIIAAAASRLRGMAADKLDN